MASKSYSAILPVMEISTNIMKDHGVLSPPFCFRAETQMWQDMPPIFIFEWSHLYLPNQQCWHNDLTCFVLLNLHLGKVNVTRG